MERGLEYDRRGLLSIYRFIKKKAIYKHVLDSLPVLSCGTIVSEQVRVARTQSGSFLLLVSGSGDDHV